MNAKDSGDGNRNRNGNHLSDHGEDSDSLDGGSDISPDEEYKDTGSPIQQPAPLKIIDVERALRPLQSTANRVGRQVERFAEILDRQCTRNKQQPQKDCRQVLPLVLGYKKIAHETVAQLRRIHAPEQQGQTAKSWRHRLRSSTGTSSPRSNQREENTGQGLQTTVKDLKRWEEEEQTWDLLGLMLQVEYPIPFPESQKPEFDQGFRRPHDDPNLQHFSTEKELWAHFLAEDDLAWERHTVVEWLRKCADGSGEDIDVVIKEMESDAERGSGLWAHSWLYTKEAIKRQKRLRSWPQPLDPNAPGLDTSILVADHSKGLVTQLDPDAITRQMRILEEKDHYFERAMWLACWEMLRRGKAWDYVREWCRDRVEGWRAMIMLGDPRFVSQAEDGPGADRPLAANWQSRALWRKTCAVAAKNGGVDIYENAVYGALSGYLPSIKSVCSSWNDFLFAHYNSYLLRQFDRYVRCNFSERLPIALKEKYGCYKVSVGAGQRAQSGNQIIRKMKTLARTGKEAREPFKMLQGSLIAKSFDDFVCAQGVQLSQSANQTEKSKILPRVVTKLPDEVVVANITMDDHDLLRIVTHTLFIFQDLGLSGRDDGQRTAMENFVVAYIDYLSKAGKYQLLPLYASRLSTKRAMSCLGRQLPSIRDPLERQTTMRLMKQYGIDVLGVLGMQLSLIISDNPADGANSPIFPKLDVLEATKDEKSLVHQIKAGFIGKSLSIDEQELINGFEWYLLLDGHWRQTVAIGAVMYKHFLRTRGLAAARELCIAIPFSKISIRKTPAIFGKAEDLSQSLEDSGDEDAFNDVNGHSRSRWSRTHRRRRSSSVRRGTYERRILLQQARTFRDLEALFVALDAMGKWKELADQAASFPEPRPDGQSWRGLLQQAYEEVEASIQPMLHGWLQYPKDDKEADEFERIRIACIPEVILAYNTVLNYSGYSISRDILLKCMDLAALIAAEGSDLVASFVAAGRMPELVESLALSSRNMIQAEERGFRPGKSRRKPNGERLDLWTTKPPPAPAEAR